LVNEFFALVYGHGREVELKQPNNPARAFRLIARHPVLGTFTFRSVDANGSARTSWKPTRPGGGNAVGQ
jgi:hypothetical protein